jgi:dihydroflavonol-4-reductase
LIKKVLVTGGSGFIGSNLIEALGRLNIKTICPVRSRRAAKFVTELGARPFYADLLNPAPWASAVAEADVVFHLAGLVRAHCIEDYHRDNVQATKNLLDVMDANGPPEQRIIMLSSLAAVGPSSIPPGRTEKDTPQPLSAYGRSKLAAERQVMNGSNHRLTTIVRAPAVYGPRDIAFLPLFRSIGFGIAPVFKGHDFPLSLIYVKDLVQILIELSRRTDNPALLHVCDEAAHSWKALCMTGAQKMGKSVRLLQIPMRAIRLLCILNSLSDRFRRQASFLNLDKWREINAPGWLCGSIHPRQKCGLPPPIPLKEGIMETFQWYREHRWL